MLGALLRRVYGDTGRGGRYGGEGHTASLCAGEVLSNRNCTRERRDVCEHGLCDPRDVENDKQSVDYETARRFLPVYR